MRTTAKVFGIVSMIMVTMGVALKMVHFPGGSILLILGTGLFVFFLLFLGQYSTKAATTQIEKSTSMLGYYSGASLALGLMFEVQHWQGSKSMFLVGGIGCALFLVLHFINLSKYEVDRKKFGVFDVLVVVSFAMLFLGRSFAIDSTIETQKKIVECEKLIVQENAQEQNNHEMYLKVAAVTTDSQTVLVAKQLDENTAKILTYINSIKRTLIGLEMSLDDRAVSDTFSPRLIHRATDYDLPTHYMIGSDPANVTGQSKNLKVAVVDYYNTVCQLIPQKDFCEKIKEFVPADEKGKLWEASHFYHKTIIEDLTALVQLKIEILNVEQVAFEQLQKNSPK